MNTTQRGLLLTVIACTVISTLLADEQARPEPSQRPSTEQLVQAILDGKDRDGELAFEVVDRTLGPLLSAIDHADPQTFAQLRELDRLTTLYLTQLRLRLIRMGMPDADRRLLDDWVDLNPEQAARLLAAPLDARLDALNELPLTPGSVTGVLLVALTEDHELEIANQAFKHAAKLHDEVVARNMTRQLAKWLNRAEDESYRPDELPYRLLFLQFANQAAEILRQCEWTGSAEVLRRGLKLQMESRLPAGYDLIWNYVLALGAVRDQAAVPMLLELLGKQRVHWQRNLPEHGGLLVQSVGDAALISLLRIYELDPAGTEITERDVGDWSTGGFLKRKQALRVAKAFEAWHKANADLPPEQREPLSQYLPAENP
jgi:hypothetical protein